MGHALHVLLDDGLQQAGHPLLLGHVPADEVVLHQAVVQPIEPRGALAVILQHPVALHQLVDAVQIIHSPRLLDRRVQHILTEGDKGPRITQQPHQRGQNVDLLRHLVFHTRLHQFATRVKDKDGRTEATQVGLILSMVAHVGVVAGQHKDGVAIPRLAAGLLEEAAQSHVGIADALVDGQRPLGKAAFVLLGDDKRVVRRGGEHSSHERLAHRAHLCAVVLQERLVPDGPGAVKVFVAAEARVLVELGAAIVVLEARAAGKGLEAHTAVLRPVEEGRLVALLAQQVGDAAHVVHRCRCEEERLDKHRYARQDGRHAIDALAAVAIGVGERQTLADERVDARGVAPIVASLQVVVIGSDILAAEALDDEHDHILLDKGHRVGGLVHGTIDSLELGGVAIVVGHAEHIFAQRAQQRERRVQHQGGIHRARHPLVGVAHRDGTHCRGEAASHACHTQRYGHHQGTHHGQVIAQPVEAATVETGLAVEPPQAGNDSGGQQHQVPVPQGLAHDDARQIALVAKLAQHSAGGAPHREGEVDPVGHVDDEGQAVDHHKDPSQHAVIGRRLLEVQRQQHQHNPQDVGIDDGRRVKLQTAHDKVRHIALQGWRQQRPVQGQIGQPRHRIGDVDQRQIDHNSPHRRQQ